MRIQNSYVEMTSKNLYTNVRAYRRKNMGFMQDMKDLQRKEEDKEPESQRGILVTGVNNSSPVYKVSSDSEMSPSDEFALRLELFMQLMRLILYGGDDPKNYAPGESYTSWNRVSSISGFSVESQHTAFESKGMVKTADGRGIEFNVGFAMSSVFAEKFEAITAIPYAMTDPLIINLSDNVPGVSDQKFFFDLDADGEKEEISFAAKGSGFLAIDKNGDGIINDGNELFGTKSGDGFLDLAKYDDDKNGWIDENDEVFKRLRVWTLDENGEQVLLDLKEADVGAVFLGHADTEFSLRDPCDELVGMMRSSGIFLHESTGAAGIVSHVDLAHIVEA